MARLRKHAAVLLFMGLFLPQGLADNQPAISSKIITLPQGFVALEAINHSSVPVTALAVVGERELSGPVRKISSVRFFDSTLDMFSDQPLKTDESHRFEFFGPKPPPSECHSRSVAVKAALFADGSTFGEQKWISILLQRRRLAYHFDRQALDMLMEAKVKGGADAASLFSRLDRTRSIETSRGATIVERQIAEICFDEVESIVRRPQSPEGHSQPAGSVRLSLKGEDNTDRAIQRLLVRIRALKEARPSAAE